MFVHFEAIHLYALLAVLAIVLAVIWMKTRNFSCVFFCAFFGVYLISAISVTVFPFFISGPNPNFLYNFSLNLIPFNFGSCFQDMPEHCAKGIFKNILLTVPFGFLISFIVPIKPKHTAWVILAIGGCFEFTQLVMAFILQNSFRAIDINDVIFNTTGAFIGYLLFKLCTPIIQKLNLHPTSIVH